MDRAFYNEENTIDNYASEPCLDERNYNNVDDPEYQNYIIVETSPKGRFIRFNEELGSGAYKKVYRGYDRDTGCEIAWNTIELERLPQKERKRISQEIALLRGLNNPKIIKFISAWINKSKKQVVLISEVVTGGSLKKYLRKTGKPKLKVIKSWCKDILLGLEYLHNLQPNIIHRDIKCDNIFVNSNTGEILIGDLGLATSMNNEFACSVLGTPEFMAPEMYDEIYGPLVDIYSFGMCVLEIVTLQTPYSECNNPAQIYKKVLNGQKPDAINLIANDEVKNFILECLQNKEDRPTASMLLKHRFLEITDNEENDQPVLLKRQVYMNKIDEESIEISNLLNQPFVKLNEKDSIIQDTIDDNKSTSEKSSIYMSKHNKISYENLKNSDYDPNQRTSIPFQAPPMPYQEHIIFNNNNNEIKDKRSQINENNDYDKPIIISEEIIKNEMSKRQFIDYGKSSGKKSEEKQSIVEKSKLSFQQMIELLKKEQPIDEPFMQKKIEELDQRNDGIPPSLPKLPLLLNAESNLKREVNLHERSQADNNNYSLTAEHFRNHYQAYLASIQCDDLNNETEETMNKRHLMEINELQKLHDLQKKSLLDKNKKYEDNNISISSFFHGSDKKKPQKNNNSFSPTESNTYEIEECQQKNNNLRHFNYLPFVSPVPSRISYQNELYSVNNSVGTMSILQHLGNNQNYYGSLISVDESNKSHFGNFIPTLHENNNNNNNNFAYMISPNNHNTHYYQNVNNEIQRKIERDRIQDYMQNNTTINQTMNHLIGNTNYTLNSTQTVKQNENLKQPKNFEKLPFHDTLIKIKDDGISSGIAGLGCIGTGGVGGAGGAGAIGGNNCGILAEKNMWTPKHDKNYNNNVEDHSKLITMTTTKDQQQQQQQQQQDQLLMHIRENQKKLYKKDEDYIPNNHNFEFNCYRTLKISEINNEKLMGNSENPVMNYIVQNYQENISDNLKQVQLKMKSSYQTSEIFPEEKLLLKNEGVVDIQHLYIPCRPYD